MNEVEIRVTAKNDTKPGLSSSKADVEKFSADFDRLITKSLKDGETAFQSTTKRAGELRGELNQMRADFAKTGNQGLFGDIKKSEADLKFLEDAVKEMMPRVEEEFHKGGKHSGDEFVKGLPFGIGNGAMALAGGLTSLIEKLAPKVAEDATLLGEKAGKAMGDGITSGADAAAQDIPQLFTPEGAIGAAIVAGAIGTLAPLAASAIGWALAFGVGAGVIGIGAVIEHNTPRIADALDAFKTRTADAMKDAAWPLVEPFHAALEQVDAWIHDEGRDFSDIFTAAAPGVKGLTSDVLGFISATLPGVRDVAEMFGEMASDPQTQADFERLGSAVSDLFTTIGQNKQTIEDTFSVIVDVVGIAIGMFDVLLAVAQGFDSVIRGIAAPIEWLAKKVGLVGDAGDATLIPMKDNTDALIPPTEKLATSYDELAGMISKTAVTADTLAGAMTDKILGSLMSSDRATLHWEESLTTLAGTLKDNSNALSIHTAKGQADREAILASVEANIQQYDTMIAAGGSAEVAAGKYDKNTRALEKQLHAAGLTDKQIGSLIGKYKGIPAKVPMEIAMTGLEKAIEDLNKTIRLVNGLDGKVIHIHTVYGAGPAKASAGEPQWSPPPVARATGGIAGGLTWLGEQGAELARLPQGTTVYPHGQSMAMAAQSGGGPMTVNVQMTFGGSTDTAMATAIQNMVRTGKIQLTAQVGGQVGRVKVG